MAKSIGEVARTAAVALVGVGLCAGGAGLWRLGDAVARHAEGGAVWEMRDATTGGGDLGRDRDGRESIAASVVRLQLIATKMVRCRSSGWLATTRPQSPLNSSAIGVSDSLSGFGPCRLKSTCGSRWA